MKGSRIFFISFLCLFFLLYLKNPTEISPKIYRSGPLIIEEYSITRDALYDSTADYYKKRVKWRNPDPSIIDLNRKLKPLGFEFRQQSRESFDFLKNKQLILEGFQKISYFLPPNGENAFQRANYSYITETFKSAPGKRWKVGDGWDLVSFIMISSGAK
jgi:hypothetical protein